MSWGLWFTIIAAIIGSGKFLDEYHVRNKTKSLIREKITNWFIFLDETKVPDIGGYLLCKLNNIHRIPRFLLILLIPLLCYWSTLTGFYVGRTLFETNFSIGYVEYIVNWIPYDRTFNYWALYLCTFLIPSITSSFFLIKYTNKSSMQTSDIRRAFYLIAGILIASFILFVGLCFTHILGADKYRGVNMLIASFGSVFLPSLLLFITLFLIFIRIFTNFIRSMLLSIFNVASSPTVSPLTYASSALGVSILIGKIVFEIYRT